MTSNLPKFIAIEKIIQTLGHGNLSLDLQVHGGKIVAVETSGNKKTLYNCTEEDVHNNQSAMEYIVKRLMRQLESGVSSELVFKVSNIHDKIKSVEISSTQTLK